MQVQEVWEKVNVQTILEMLVVEVVREVLVGMAYALLMKVGEQKQIVLLAEDLVYQ